MTNFCKKLKTTCIYPHTCTHINSAYLKKNHIETIKLKNTITQIKNSVDGFNSILDTKLKGKLVTRKTSQKKIFIMKYGKIKLSRTKIIKYLFI